MNTPTQPPAKTNPDALAYWRLVANGARNTRRITQRELEEFNLLLTTTGIRMLDRYEARQLNALGRKAQGNNGVELVSGA